MKSFCESAKWKRFVPVGREVSTWTRRKAPSVSGIYRQAWWLLRNRSEANIEIRQSVSGSCARRSSVWTTVLPSEYRRASRGARRIARWKRSRVARRSSACGRNRLGMSKGAGQSLRFWFVIEDFGSGPVHQAAEQRSELSPRRGFVSLG